MNESKKAPRAPGLSFQDFLNGYTSHPIPDYLRIDKSEWLGDEPIEVDRYITREAAALEKERIWKKVWQMACREEEIPVIGDSIVYDITDISIIVVRSAVDEIKAYYNVCLHQGRQLRDGPCRDKEFRCPYHAFAWNLDGTVKNIPSRWDFPQIENEKFRLAEVKIGRWGGFVFINMDPQAESLESYLGDMPMHWERFPLEERYIAGHVAKIFRANWKVAQEAFMEAFHNNSTHSQFGIYFGGSHSDSGQYDPMGNYSRAIGQGSAEIQMRYTPTREERLAALSGHGYPRAPEIVQAQYLDSGEEDIMAFELKTRRSALRELIGDKVDELTDFEVFGGGYFTLFPNFHPWWTYDELTYRFRPYGDDPEICVMETYMLRAFQGERPPPEPIRWIGLEESHLDAADVLGMTARIFDQDEHNIESVQKGLHNLKAIGRGLMLGTYQATKIRHFHKLWDKWIHGDGG